MIRRPPRSTLFPTRRSSDLLDAVDAPLRDPRLHEVERTDDAGQQVVEVMRDAAGELADRLHLLRLAQLLLGLTQRLRLFGRGGDVARSEEHTSELQSRQYLVCRLLLEKKKKQEKQRVPCT